MAQENFSLSCNFSLARSHALKRGRAQRWACLALVLGVKLLPPPRADWPPPPLRVSGGGRGRESKANNELCLLSSNNSSSSSFCRARQIGPPQNGAHKTRDIFMGRVFQLAPTGRPLALACRPSCRRAEWASQARAIIVNSRPLSTTISGGRPVGQVAGWPECRAESAA